jgi:hypothetical protein
MYLGEQKRDKCTKRLERITRNKALGVKYTTVTEEEKNIIVKAIDLSQGHWFKCPKGKINNTRTLDISNNRV